MGVDYYGLLEINKSASDDDIQNAYRKLALKYHPKRNSDPQACERFAAIAEAYDVLSSSKFKALYDQFGEEAIKNGVHLPPGPGETESHVEIYTFLDDPIKVFLDFFGVDSEFLNIYLSNLDSRCSFLEGRTSKLDTEPNLEHVFPLSLEEAFHGTTESIDVPMQVVDETGKKTVRVVKNFTFRVPKGTTNGHCFYFKSAGSSGPNKLPGNVTFKAEIQPHPEFKLEGYNIVVTKNIDLVQALIGCTLNISTFDGKTINIPISEVIKPKQRMHLKGEGMRKLGHACKGDLILEFDISFPKQLSFRQKELLQQALIESLEK